MEKISEKILLEKGLPKTNKLAQIKTLNLSLMGLKSEDLPVYLLSKLHSLEQLDLSGNMLQEFPKGLCLPCLKILDCSNNEMEDVVSLEGLSNMEELRLEDNIYLTVNDEHKVIFLLPKLRMFNGKHISSMAHHIRHGSTEILTKRVIGVWERSFSLPDQVTKQSLATVEKSFVRDASTQIKYGPSSLSDYTKWRIEMIAKEYLQSLACSKEEHGVTTPTKENESPAKKQMCDTAANGTTSPPKRTRNADITAEASPRKSSRLSNASTVEASTRKSSRLLSSPMKTETILSSPRKQTRTTIEAALEGSPRKSSRIENIPQKGASKTESPSKAPKSPAVSTPTSRLAKCESPRKTVKDQPTPQKGKTTKTETGTPRKTANGKVSQEPVSLQPIHVLQCHSRQDSPEDFDTQLWACAFEPPQDCGSDLSGGSRTVATCGGETLCVIDCESGHVLKKYKVPGEEFFSLAWSTVLMSRTGGSARPCNILAAGGKRGLVKLIHPRVNLAFGEFRASRRAISIVRFSPCNTTFLFTGTYENKIILWDIGGLDRDYNFQISKLLVLETSSTPLHLCLLPGSQDTQLLSACDEGLFCFDIQLSKNIQKRNEEMEIVFPIYKKNDKKNSYRTIDGLSFLLDDIVASKSHMQGSIYLWSWSATRASWSGKKKEVTAVVLTELQWSSTDIPYLSLGTCPGYGYVVCGDEKGSLWTYHVTVAMIEHFKSGKTIAVTEVLGWPSPVRAGKGPVEGPSINSVAMDPDLRYLVALTDKNMAVVWRREKSH
ncbi:leucine-rich repeat and WD repeat-containing protein 1 [Triplophysa rosa]|uniref:Leucine-rich repeat and WD repeat-containing protein 1 n=1 Tax=Triplophysa rosa TaxID=992332 RepID=A0A9W7X3M4_TRIRA|nr:leucine-rich repeat and WD repeat-containing protein 1 [Triplophysa rosa]KAI7813517.1 putative leucine-rich repeat and WD repeat-containing protein 1 [Triplophysa rosa]